MTAKRFWTQAHWLIGITAGSLLLLIGLSGAVLSFREELLDALNPGGRQVAPRAHSPLTPDGLLDALATAHPHEKPTTLALYAKPGRAARVILAAKAGERRGETLYLDPYTGATLPELRGADFFETTEALHRWLLLPREPGRVAAGTLAIGLMLLALTGLYLRWPRQLTDWRQWWHVDPKLEGRAMWRRLHLVVGTACLPLYLVLTATGIYWSFDAVRDPVSAWLGEPRAQRVAMGGAKDAKDGRDAKPKPARKSDVGAAAGEGAGKSGNAETESAPATESSPSPRLDAAWRTFESVARIDGSGRALATAGWTEASVRVPATPKAAVVVTWLDSDAPHERARNKTTLKQDGALTQDERFAEKPLGGRALAAIYPLHMGTYFGLPGRVVMMIAALMLPAFTITGWWLYLGRRKLERQAALKRRQREASLSSASASA